MQLNHENMQMPVRRNVGTSRSRAISKTFRRSCTKNPSLLGHNHPGCGRRGVCRASVVFAAKRPATLKQIQKRNAESGHVFSYDDWLCRGYVDQSTVQSAITQFEGKTASRSAHLPVVCAVRSRLIP